MKNKAILLISTISLMGCAPQNPPVYCHEWARSDANDIKAAIVALPDDSPLHAVIRDYERVCISLKS